jgi:hypothetical protein
MVIVKTCTGNKYWVTSLLVGRLPILASLAFLNRDNILFITINIMLFVKLFVISPFFLKKIFFKSLYTVAVKFIL